MSKVQDELNQKTSEVTQLQMELQRRDHDETDKAVEDSKIAISTLEKENSTLKVVMVLYLCNIYQGYYFSDN